MRAKRKLAFRTLSQLKWPGAGGQVELIADAYEQLKKWKGDAGALAWIQSAVPQGPARLTSTIVIFPHRDLSLLWTLVDQPGDGDNRDFVWLMRAAAILLSPEQRAAHEKDIRAYYADATHNGDYAAMGRYLLGLVDEKTLLKLAATAQRRCEIAYYIGLKAMSENRLADASDWFRVACETGQSKQGEYRWAKDTLLQWADRSLSISAIAKRGAVRGDAASSPTHPARDGAGRRE